MNEQVTRLAGARARVRGLYILYLISLLACTLLFYGSRMAAGVCLVLCIAAYILVVRRAIKRYRASVRIACVRSQAERALSQTEYREKGGVERQDVDRWKLLPPSLKDGFLVRDFIQGMAGPAQVACCDLTYAYRSGGRAQAEFLSGCWFRATLPGDTGIHLHAVDPAVYPEAIRRELFRGAVSFTHEGMDGLLCFLGDAQSERIPSGVASMIRGLAGYTTGQLALCIDGDRLCIFLRGRFLSGQNISLRTKISPALLEADALPELERMARIAERLSKTST